MGELRVADWQVEKLGNIQPSTCQLSTSGHCKIRDFEFTEMQNLDKSTVLQSPQQLYSLFLGMNYFNVSGGLFATI